MNPIKKDKQNPKAPTFPEEKSEIIRKSTAMSEKMALLKKKPLLRFSSQIYISSFSQESVLKCKLKEDAPDQVSVQAGCYLTGQRVFNKMDQPFRVTESEWSGVLNRGRKLFYLIRK